MADGPFADADDFTGVSEVVRTLLLSNAEGDFRVELLKVHKGERPGFKPRIYRQEAVVVQAAAIPRPQEMLVWREYEMGFVPAEDEDTALRLALSVIRNKRGR